MEEKNNINNIVETPEIVAVSALLSMNNLRIPIYQRPYKWSTKSVFTLWNDIKEAVSTSKQFRQENKQFKYRLGSVILHKTKDEKDNEIFEVVDGQQRITTLLLILNALEEKGLYVESKGNHYSVALYESIPDDKFKFNFSILNNLKSNEDPQKNCEKNLDYIKNLIKITDEQSLAEMLQSFFTTLEVVIFVTCDIDEAFQLFDSQNSRGKSLYPHDLLKAYHLRAMPTKNNLTYRVIKNWEEINEKEFMILFNDYLFPILNWSKNQNTHYFTAKDIDFYKGVSANANYTLADRLKTSANHYIINEPFIEGKDFFDMTMHYLDLLNDINEKINTGDDIFEQIRNVIKTVASYRYSNNNEKYLKNLQELEKADDIHYLDWLSRGFSYAFNLFKCALLFYYNKFSNFDPVAVKNIFVWAMNIRLSSQILDKTSINKYAKDANITIDFEDDADIKSTMFYEIANARSHITILGLKIEVVDVVDSNNEHFKKVQKERKALSYILKNFL